eukprot:4748059-Pleurochrysis_carterae.AAC.1
MSEELCAGSPALFGPVDPIGAHLLIDLEHTGVQRLAYTFGDGNRQQIEVAAVHMSQANHFRI